MDVIHFIEIKKAGEAHRADDIGKFIRLLVNGEIPDYQAAAWLMAVNFNGLDLDESTALTDAIVKSGKVAVYDDLPGPVVDKHSTGGVGDKVTLVLLPILAEMGMFIPKHSGRSLGFTGGTIDKLESIPGFNAFIPDEEFHRIVREVGFAIGGQSPGMCPADGILYALRDATATVNEIGLIAASVMSKIAGGAHHILIDIKIGRGAFMHDEESAMALAERVVYIGKALGRNVRYLLSRMDSPLGRAVGNSLEVYEAVDCLRGKGPGDVMRLCRNAAVILSSMTGLYDEASAGKAFDDAVTSGAALQRFRGFVSAQGGETDWIDREEGLPVSKNIFTLRHSGPGALIESIDGYIIGETVRRMGGGRLSKEDKVDHGVGVVIRKSAGKSIKEGDVIAEVHCREVDDPHIWTDRILSAFKVTPLS